MVGHLEVAGDGGGIDELAGMGGGSVLLEDFLKEGLDVEVELPEGAVVDVDAGVHHGCAGGHADAHVGVIVPGFEGAGEGGELGEGIDSGGGAAEGRDAHGGELGVGEGDDARREGGIDDALVVADDAGVEEEEAVGAGRNGVPVIVNGAEAVEEIVGIAGAAVGKVDEEVAGGGVGHGAVGWFEVSRLVSGGRRTGRERRRYRVGAGFCCGDCPGWGAEGVVGGFLNPVLALAGGFPYTRGRYEEDDKSMRNPSKATVLIVDAEPVMRCGLATLINSDAGLRVCAEADGLRTGRAACERWRPDVVVLEVGLGGGEGFALVRELPRWSPLVRVVAFTRLEDAGSVQRALRAGVWGYVTRLDPMEWVLRAIAGALLGERHVGPRVERALLETLAMGTVQMAGDDLARLSDREGQVFRLIGGGMGTVAVAAELGLSVKTVETHRQRIKEKLGLRSGVELAQRAVLFLAGQGG